MNIEQRITAFSALGKCIQEMIACSDEQLNTTINRAIVKNPWFTKEDIVSSLKGICKFLDADTLTKWTDTYKIDKQSDSKTVAVIMAGNIPFVGFHDFLCVLVSGNKILIKHSSKDQVIPQFVIGLLTEIEPAFSDFITVTDGQLKGFDAIIATGSNSSSQYFDYYFKKYPSIIRRNRSSIAVLDGNETNEQISGLGKDIFTYFGHGCRNVSKLFVPEGFDFTTFFPKLEEFENVANHNKYGNNYDYYKSVYLLGQEQFYDNGFAIFKESSELGSPISVILFEYYSDIKQVALLLKENADTLQCIVSNNNNFHIPAVPFGHTQLPQINDYADNIDTMDFLQQL